MDDKQLLWLLLAIPVFLLFRASKEKPGVLWQYEADAIEIRYRADTGLNLYNARPHTLAMVVYQLSDPAPFREKMSDPGDLQELLPGGRFDPSVMEFRRLIVRPGEELTMQLDRVQQTQWIGLVAGYQRYAEDGMARLVHIPISTIESGWIRKRKTERVEKLTLVIDFGPESFSLVDDLDEQ